MQFTQIYIISKILPKYVIFELLIDITTFTYQNKQSLHTITTLSSLHTLFVTHIFAHLALLT